MVDIAVCEKECKNAPCSALKAQLVKVMVKKEDFVELQEFDEIVTIEDAQKAFSDDYEAFMKRNRFNDKNTLFLVSRLKNEADIETLKPYVQKKYNGWVDLTKLNDDVKSQVLANCSKYDHITGWDNLSFDESEDICAHCPLAWNKGTTCIGTFGPKTSALPEIAKKYDCPIIASAFESADSMKKFSPEDAKELLREAEVLEPVLINEGKMAAHRYSGPVERIKLMAKACVECECGFMFI
ncbi:MAG: hypothetical protein MJZ21_00840 [archaeon]|nr:hypothetical protein [archaeon]